MRTAFACQPCSFASSCASLAPIASTRDVSCASFRLPWSAKAVWAFITATWSGITSTLMFPRIAQVHKAAQAAQCAGRCAQRRRRLARETGQRWLALDGTRRPVNGILQDGRDGTVVLWRRDQEAVVRPHQFLELLRAWRQSVAHFQVTVVQGHVEIAQVDDRDLGAGPARPAAAILTSCLLNEPSRVLPAIARILGTYVIEAYPLAKMCAHCVCHRVRDHARVTSDMPGAWLVGFRRCAAVIDAIWPGRHRQFWQISGSRTNGGRCATAICSPRWPAWPGTCRRRPTR